MRDRKTKTWETITKLNRLPRPLASHHLPPRTSCKKILRVRDRASPAVREILCECVGKLQSRARGWEGEGIDLYDASVSNTCPFLDCPSIRILLPEHRVLDVGDVPSHGLLIIDFDAPRGDPRALPPSFPLSSSTPARRHPPPLHFLALLGSLMFSADKKHASPPRSLPSPTFPPSDPPAVHMRGVQHRF